MKVLFLIDTLAVGGAERSTLEIAQQFRATRASICHIYAGDTLRPEYEAAGIPVISLNIRAKYGFPRAIRAVRKIIRKQKPDLIHACLFRAGLIGRIVAKRERMPIVDSFVSDSYCPERIQRLPMLGRCKLQAIRVADKWTARLVSRFMAITQAIKFSNCQSLGLAPDCVDVIYRGRCPSTFTAMSRERIAVVRRDLRICNGASIILNVARCVEHKGQADLLQAMPRVLNGHPATQLLIAGDGPFRTRLKELISRLGLDRNVTLLGNRNDVADLLAVADVFAFPSHWEGQGGALIEAMFSATPIVASDIAVLRESVTHGDTARLFRLGDSDSLAREISWFLDRPTECQNYGVRGRADALKRFEIRKIAQQHEELYRRVLDE
ncbi:MAG: glycosyltransferase family 4 protein, partial [Pirellulales bacterium]|nr:glycosyltransferase family 4 protein [Pirellulales bacterium]